MQVLQAISSSVVRLLATDGAFLDRDGAACINCHSGPNLTDGKFHNIGVAPGTSGGRDEGIAQLLSDPFNGAGVLSDDRGFGERRLASAASEDPAPGAFKTPSLRGVTQRAPYGHLGASGSLREWFDDVYDRGGRRGRRGRGDDDGRSPLLGNIRGGDERNLIAFLETLECPPLPIELTQAPAAP